MKRDRPARRADDRARRGRRTSSRRPRSTAPATPGSSRPGPRRPRTSAIDLVIEQAKATGGRAHVVHLSCADAVPALHAARAAGVDVSVETCPHYLTFDAEHIADGATELQVLPADPRGRQPRGAVGRARRRRHRLRRLRPLAVHRQPQGARRRRLRRGLGRHRVGPARPARGVDRRPGRAATRWSTWCAGWRPRPADRVGLAHKGRIEVGADADLVRFAPDEEFTVDVARLHHRNPVSAYAGRRLTGVVRETWLRGVPVDRGCCPGTTAAPRRAMSYRCQLLRAARAGCRRRPR